MLEWANQEDFRRIRAEWLQLHRWDRDLSPTSKVVLAEIGGWMAYDRDWAWPSIPRLAAEFGWSEPTVKRGVAQPIERGWLMIERRSFGGSNHYGMACSPSVVAAVTDDHERRVASFVETRPAALRSKLIRMGGAAIEIKSDPSLGSNLIPHTDQIRSLIEIDSDPLSCLQNLSKEPDHKSLSDRLGETEQDVDLDHPPFEISDLHSALGCGDLILGRRRADRLGEHRLDYLLQKIAASGAVDAADDINAAIEAATDTDPRQLSFGRTRGADT